MSQLASSALVYGYVSLMQPNYGAGRESDVVARKWKEVVDSHYYDSATGSARIHGRQPQPKIATVQRPLALDLSLSDACLDTAWNSARALMVADGEDPDEVLRSAAAALDGWRTAENSGSISDETDEDET